MARHHAVHRAPAIHEPPTPWEIVDIFYAGGMIQHIVSERYVGSSRTRHAEFKTQIIWPEKYHEAYKLPTGIESQPF